MLPLRFVTLSLFFSVTLFFFFFGSSYYRDMPLQFRHGKVPHQARLPGLVPTYLGKYQVPSLVKVA
jgi:hypothetical protein